MIYDIYSKCVSMILNKFLKGSTIMLGWVRGGMGDPTGGVRGCGVIIAFEIIKVWLVRKYAIITCYPEILLRKGEDWERYINSIYT